MVNLFNSIENLMKHKANLDAYWCDDFLLMHKYHMIQQTPSHTCDHQQFQNINSMVLLNPKCDAWLRELEIE